MRKMAVLLSTIFLLAAHAADETAGLSPEDLAALESDVYLLPSPNEIMKAARLKGLKIESSAAFPVFSTDISSLARIDRLGTAFVLGRMFASGGLNYETLSNESILKLSEVLHNGIIGLKLPDSILGEIGRQYRSFLEQPRIQREELILSFTEARSSLLTLLQEDSEFPASERDEVRALATALEAGLWLQSLCLFIENNHGETANSAIQELLLQDEVLGYFDEKMARLDKSHRGTLLLREIHSLLDIIRVAKGDGKLSPEDANAIALNVRKIIGS